MVRYPSILEPATASTSRHLDRAEKAQQMRRVHVEAVTHKDSMGCPRCGIFGESRCDEESSRIDSGNKAYFLCVRFRVHSRAFNVQGVSNTLKVQL